MMRTALSKEWPSWSALAECLATTGSQSVVIGQASQSPRQFFSLSASAGPEVGVVASGMGISPAGVLSEDGCVMIVGHDLLLTWVNLESLSIQEQYRLGGAFYEFIDVGGRLLALHELGVVCVDFGGRVCWAVDSAVIESHTLDEAGNLILDTDIGVRIVVEVDSGKTARLSSGDENASD